MPPPAPLPPRMLLGFVVRRCAAALGRDPSPEEFAEWANNFRRDGRVVSLFGRKISVTEARLILRHPAREVTARLGVPGGPAAGGEDPAAVRVVRFPDTRRRSRPRIPK